MKGGTTFRFVTDVHTCAGERPLDGVGELALEPLKVIGSPTVTHVKYRVVH